MNTNIVYWFQRLNATYGFCIDYAWRCSWRLGVLIEEWFDLIWIMPNWISLDLSLLFGFIIKKLMVLIGIISISSFVDFDHIPGHSEQPM